MIATLQLPQAIDVHQPHRRVVWLTERLTGGCWLLSGEWVAVQSEWLRHSQWQLRWIMQLPPYAHLIAAA